MSYLLQEHIWLPPDRIAAAETVTPATLVARAQRALRRTHVTSYVHGDLAPSAAVTLHNDCMAILDANAVHTETALTDSKDHASDGAVEVPSRARAMSAGHHVVALPGFNPDDPNSALLTHIQVHTEFLQC
jgi:secreted Zn-dependent insulinase-like peptidase